MKISKILACLMAAIMFVTPLTAVVYANNDVLEDDYEVILDEGCLCGENGDCRKPCVTTAFEESKPITKKTDNTVATTKKPTVTTAKTTTEPKPVVTSTPEVTKPVVTSVTAKSEPNVPEISTPATTATPEKEPSLTEGGSNESWFCCRSHFANENDSLLVLADKAQRSCMFSDLLSMFGDMDFEIGDLGGIGGFGTDTPLTPDGNMSLVDDIYQNESYKNGEEEVIQSKQFITVQTKSGNVFYIIIDRSKEGENVYFLNLVDESDLMALMDLPESTETPAEPEKPAECICKGKDKCELGAVNTDCEVCKVDLTKCSGKEKPKEEVKSDVVEKPAPEAEKKSINPALLLLPLLVIAGGAAYWFFKIRKPSGKTKSTPNPDDYGFSEDSYDDFSENELIEEEPDNEAEKEQ